jgi:NADH-quinone oxidoreductase subunit L
MFRLVILTFLGEHKDPERMMHIHESPRIMTIPLIVLAVLCVSFVFSVNPLDAAEGWVARSLPRPESVVPLSVAAPPHEVFEPAHHHAHYTAMVLSLLVAGLGILLAFVTYRWKRISADDIAERMSPLHRFLLNKWYFDDIYNSLVVGGTLAWTRAMKWFDDTIIDGIVNGSGSITKVTSFISGRFDSIVIDGFVNLTAHLSGLGGLVLRKIQTGKVQTYAVFAVFGVMLLYFFSRLGIL